MAETGVLAGGLAAEMAGRLVATMVGGLVVAMAGGGLVGAALAEVIVVRPIVPEDPSTLE